METARGGKVHSCRGVKTPGRDLTDGKVDTVTQKDLSKFRHGQPLGRGTCGEGGCGPCAPGAVSHGFRPSLLSPAGLPPGGPSPPPLRPCLPPLPPASPPPPLPPGPLPAQCVREGALPASPRPSAVGEEAPGASERPGPGPAEPVRALRAAVPGWCLARMAPGASCLPEVQVAGP